MILFTEDERAEAIRLLRELEHRAAERTAAYPDSEVRAHEYRTVRKLEEVVRTLSVSA